MVMIQGIQETSEHIRPIQFIEVGKQPQVSAPFLRITTCGLLSIEVVEEIVSTDPPLARYVSLTPEQLRGRGTAPALTLLKLLLSRPERFALKDGLMDAFCRDRELFSNVRLDNIVSLLRGLLCPPHYGDLRTHLVAHVRSSPGGGDGYQLAPYPLIWVDNEALTRYGEQAARMERFGDDALPYWEQAYALAKRGIYVAKDTLPMPQIDGNRVTKTGLVPCSPTETLERLSRALAKPSPLDETTLLALEKRVQDCWHFRPDILGIISSNLLQVVLEHLQQVSTFLAGALLPSIRTRLCALACELAQIAGWTLYEMRSFLQAQAYYELLYRATTI
jgi:hypothetical protein